MKNQIREDFRKFLETGGYCTPPGRAACALDSARTLANWREAEGAGLVRLRSEPEEENYFDVYGEPEAYEGANGRRVTAEMAKAQIVETLENWGCFCVISEVFEDGEWVHADSIGFCVYEDPLDPFDNSYVVDLMAKAMEQIPVCGEH